MPTAWNNVTKDQTDQELKSTLINKREISIQEVNSETITIPSADQLKLTSIPKIAIGIPYNNNWIPEWVHRTYLPLMSQQTDWCQKQIFLSRVPSISVARNTLVKQALDTNCDFILFLDSDHVAENPDNPNIALNSLYNVINKSKDKNSVGYKDGRIASGLYRAKQKNGLNYAMWMKANDGINKGFVSVPQWTGNWIKVDVIGLGFCLIDIMVFREIHPPWFVWNDPNGISEDFYFCERAKEYGFDTRVLTDVKLSHLGNLKVKCNGTVTTQDV